MIGVRKISHAVYESPDLEHQLEYYTDVLGLTLIARERDTAYLANTIEHHSVILRAGSHPRCTAIGFQIGPDGDLDGFEKQTAAQGIHTKRKKDAEPTIDDMVTFEDPKGTIMEVFRSPEPLKQTFTNNGVVPHKLGHIAFHVTDVQRITRFYCDVLGFRVSDWMGDYLLVPALRPRPSHHQSGRDRQEQAFPHRLRAARLGAYADRARFHQQARIQDAVGPRPARHRP